MQNSVVNTPATRKREGGTARKSSGKKLVQARLPFKIITGGTPTAAASSVSSNETDEAAKDGRKRKLSFEAEEDEKAKSTETDEFCVRSASKENLTVSSKKLKTVDEQSDVLLLDDDSVEDEDGKIWDAERKEGEQKAGSSEKVGKQVNKNPIAIKTPKSIKKTKNTKGNSVTSPHTPKASTAKEKDANTPRSAPGSTKNKSSNSKAGDATKVQVKLPIGNTKTNKRRKYMITADSNDVEVVISSDENEEIPVKRQKVDSQPSEQKKVESI